MAARTLLRTALQCTRSYATAADAKSLLFIEHKDGKIIPGSLNAVTAAQKLGTDITGFVTGGADAKQLADSLKGLPLQSIIVHSADALKHQLAEPVAPIIAKLVKDHGFTHLVAAHSALGKNIIPRVAGILDVAQISDVTEIIASDTFKRPIYAGNAIATVKSTDAIKLLTVRTSAFEAAATEGGSAEVKAEESSAAAGPAEWVSEQLTKSERPDLGSAKRVVSGGRGVKNKENFEKLIVPLADALGAAVGASRAAVDSGYADNSLQVGQTGKVVAPELYVAVGISGAIQHLAGMKDSKTIVAINKDPEAPIFQVADMGLVADLFEAVPELTKAAESK